jgi:hypothetical protein
MYKYVVSDLLPLVLQDLEGLEMARKEREEEREQERQEMQREREELEKLETEKREQEERERVEKEEREMLERVISEEDWGVRTRRGGGRKRKEEPAMDSTQSREFRRLQRESKILGDWKAFGDVDDTRDHSAQEILTTNSAQSVDEYEQPSKKRKPHVKAKAKLKKASKKRRRVEDEEEEFSGDETESEEVFLESDEDEEKPATRRIRAVVVMEEDEEEIESVVNNETRPEENWVFKCLCGVEGVNYDDGKESIGCDGCSTWMHVECVAKEAKLNENTANSVLNLKSELFFCDDCVKGTLF